MSKFFLKKDLIVLPTRVFLKKKRCEELNATLSNFGKVRWKKAKVICRMNFFTNFFWGGSLNNIIRLTQKIHGCLPLLKKIFLLLFRDGKIQRLQMFLHRIA